MIRYPMAQPFFPEEEIVKLLPEFRKILSGETPLSMGPNVLELENKFAALCGVSHAVATNSCSAALEIALSLLKLKSGDEVIVPAETFIATGSSVLRAGGKVVFAEISQENFCLSVADVEKKITPKTRAVILVHMAGIITPEVDRLADLCRTRGMTLIEDAAHAPGAMWKEKCAGSFGDIACFSFYPTKVMTTAEGGMLVTNNPQFYRQASSLRSRGLDLDATTEQYALPGTNNRMTEFSALLGLSQLRCLGKFLTRRREIAATYDEALTRCVLVHPLKLPKENQPSYWRYPVRLDEKIDRMVVREKLKAQGIAIDWAYDPPLHLQPLFRKAMGTKPGMLPVTEKILAHFVCLPIHSQMTHEDASFVATQFTQAVEVQCG